MFSTPILFWILLVGVFSTTPLHADTTIPVVKLTQSPVIDGLATEWGEDHWTSIPLLPAVKEDQKNKTGKLNVDLKMGITEDRLFIVARWPDNEANVDYRPWKWRGKKYKQSKKRDDMFAIRFDMGGDYYECMFSKKDYKVDLWQWSAGRSNTSNLAEDYVHIISTKPLEKSAEYDLPEGGIVYIQKIRDAGDRIYTINKPKNKRKQQGKTVPGIKIIGGGSGSLIDVSAKGTWKEGFWTLELSRKLNTGYADDVSFTSIKTIKGAIAVFNKGYAEHKSTSETLLFDLSKTK